MLSGLHDSSWLVHLPRLGAGGAGGGAGWAGRGQVGLALAQEHACQEGRGQVGLAPSKEHPGQEHIGPSHGFSRIWVRI